MVEAWSQTCLDRQKSTLPPSLAGHQKYNSYRISIWGPLRFPIDGGGDQSQFPVLIVRLFLSVADGWSLVSTVDPCQTFDISFYRILVSRNFMRVGFGESGPFSLSLSLFSTADPVSG